MLPSSPASKPRRSGRELVERDIRQSAALAAAPDHSSQHEPFSSFPSADLLDRLTRYEAHISRQLFATLHEIEAADVLRLRSNPAILQATPPADHL